MSSPIRHAIRGAATVLSLLAATACGVDDRTVPQGDAAAVQGSAPPAAQPDADGPLVVYSGRTKTLIGPAFDRVEKALGRRIEVRYGDTAELAGLLLEEGGRSPADVYIAQDAGALGALSAAGLLATLPENLLGLVDGRFRSAAGDWIAHSGRARVLAYSTERVRKDELPASVFDLTGKRWAGRVGWAPANGSFQAFVTALRVEHGDEKARRWLVEMKENGTKEYPKNAPAVAAVAAGEIDVALVNHYYLYQLRKEKGAGFPVANQFLTKGDAGALVNVAGGGVLKTSKRPAAARALLEALLAADTQAAFAAETYEYPLAAGVSAPEGVPPLAEIGQQGLDLNRLKDLEGTLKLLREAGVLR